MNKLKVLRKELDDMVIQNKNYIDLVKKSTELDFYITKAMKRLNKRQINSKKINIC